MDNIIQFPESYHQHKDSLKRPNEEILYLFNSTNFPLTITSKLLYDAQGDLYLKNGVLEARIEEERFIQNEENSTKKLPDISMYQETTSDYIMLRNIFKISVNLKDYSNQIKEWYGKYHGIRNLFKKAPIIDKDPDTIVCRTYLGTELCYFFEIQDEFRNILSLMKEKEGLSRLQYKMIKNSAEKHIEIAKRRTERKKKLKNMWNNLEEKLTTK